jgi:outer membrane protein OmpA-like peptidoglycan-associated protein
MKKSVLFSLACAAVMSLGASAQSTDEIVYVEDPSQGYTFNSFKDNWFITIDGGANIQFSHADKVRKFTDRFAPNAAIYAGKWFSPIFGARLGLNYYLGKGVSCTDAATGLVYNGTNGYAMTDGHYKTNTYNFGFVADAMLNITNWWCGYKPNRVYNFIVYGGGGVYLGYHQKGETQTDGTIDKGYFAGGHDTGMALRAGIINSFNLSKQVQLAIDLRYFATSAPAEYAVGANQINSNASALLSLTYLFNNRTWTAPVVPVIPEIPNCDPYIARIQEADAQIARLQSQLDACLNRPAAKAEAAPCSESLATVYFPAGSSTVSRTDRNVLKSVAGEIKGNGQNYTVTGWADNWTGSASLNDALRSKRADNVISILTSNGVGADQLTKALGDGNRKADRSQIYLDRCVTIEQSK